MRFTLRGPRSASSGFPTERIDVAAVIARALNAAEPIPEPIAEPSIESPVPDAVTPVAVAAAVAAVAVEPPPDTGATIAVPFSTPSTDDPLVVALLAVANSLGYDLTAEVGAGWDEITLFVPPGDGAATFSVRVNRRWDGWYPSLHSIGALEMLRAALADVDPGVGYDLAVRHREVIVCRWPHRCWDGRVPEPLDRIDEALAVPDPARARPKRRKLTRLLLRRAR